MLGSPWFPILKCLDTKLVTTTPWIYPPWAQARDGLSPGNSGLLLPGMCSLQMTLSEWRRIFGWCLPPRDSSKPHQKVWFEDNLKFEDKLELMYMYIYIYIIIWPMNDGLTEPPFMFHQDLTSLIPNWLSAHCLRPAVALTSELQPQGPQGPQVSTEVAKWWCFMLLLGSSKIFKDQMCLWSMYF